MEEYKLDNGVLKVFDKGGIRLEDIYGKAIAILGVRGSGKTNTAAVFVEELLSKGIPVIIFDIDGEYWTLREVYDVLIISSDEKADISLEISNIDQAIRLARALLDTYIPAVIDLSDFIIDDYKVYLNTFLEEIWRVSRVYKRPLFLIIEEAHEFIPQGHSNPLKSILVRIALRGRKRGLSLIMVSQRSAKVDKDVLSQAEYYILHKVIHPADMRVYKELLPMGPKELEIIVPKLEVGEAIFYDGFEAIKVKIRKRHTFHVGYTPKKYSDKNYRLKSIDKSILERVLLAIESPSISMRSSYNVGKISSQNTSIKGGSLDSKGNVKEIIINNMEHSLDSSKVLETIIELVTILTNVSPSTIAHLYILALKRKWMSYSDLKLLSGFKTINTREFKRLNRLGIIELKKHGRRKIVRQHFLTNIDGTNEIILKVLSLVYKKRVLPIIEHRKKVGSNKNVLSPTIDSNNIVGIV